MAKPIVISMRQNPDMHEENVKCSGCGDKAIACVTKNHEYVYVCGKQICINKARGKE